MQNASQLFCVQWHPLIQKQNIKKLLSPENCWIFLWTTSVTIFVVLPQSAIWRAIALQRPDRSILPWLMFLPLAWTHPYTTSVKTCLHTQYRKHVDLFYPMMLQQDSKLQSFAEREFSVCALSLWLLSGDSKAIQGTGAILNQAINCPFGTVIAHASCRVVCLAGSFLRYNKWEAFDIGQCWTRLYIGHLY